MSNEVKEIDLNLDLAFLPAWAQESPEINRYSNYEGHREDRRDDRREGRGRGPRRDRPPGGDRRDRDRDRPRDERRREPHGKPGRFSRGGPQGDRAPFPKREELPPLDLDLNVIPEPKGVDSLTKQIRMTGRAYPLFDVARLILQKEDRFDIELRTRKPVEGRAAQSLVTCALDDTAWLSEEEAVDHVLEKHLDTFYQIEKSPIDPPKGTYTFVAQCGMSGVLLGPPNYHDYQAKLHKLHQERFPNMPFERFRSRVKIVRDEEVVKKWLEEQSFKTEYVVLNVPEPMKLASWNDVREHFHAVHRPNIIKAVERHLLPAGKARRTGSKNIQRHVAHEIDQQRRFPLKLVTSLSQQFATRGLQFFKVNKTIVHVAVARPHYLDIDSEPVSAGVKRIVQYVNAHPHCSVKELVESLAPAPAIPPTPPPAPVAAEPSAGGTVPEPGSVTPAALPSGHHEPTAEQKAVLSDLHWLVHSGHVIEFASGELETAKKPLPKPPAPAKKKDPQTPPASAPAAAAGLAASSAPMNAPAEMVTESQVSGGAASVDQSAETEAVPVESEAKPDSPETIEVPTANDTPRDSGPEAA